MLNEKRLEEFIKRLRGRFARVMQFFIRKVADQIEALGELNASSVHILLTAMDNGTTFLEVTTELRKATGQTAQEIVQLCKDTAKDVTTDPRFSKAIEAYEEEERQRRLQQTPQIGEGDTTQQQEQAAAEAKAAAEQYRHEVEARVNQYAQSVAMQAVNGLENLSNTTAVSRQYREAVSDAVLAVSAGYISYGEATRGIINTLGYNGMQVYYESGYHRRLDSAARQNVIDTVRQINQHGDEIVSQELGFDAVEISAHLNSAPDHEPVQGRVFLKEEFEKMQSGMDFQDVDGNKYTGFVRPIGQWNCMHFAYGFSTKHSVRAYTNEQLQEWKQKNNDGFTYNGKKRTLYWATQKMREIETQVRREKDAANAFKAANDMEGRKSCQRRINALVARYADLCKQAGLPQHKDRMTVEGFRMVKV